MWKKKFRFVVDIIFLRHVTSAKVTDWRILGSLPAVAKDFSLLQKAHPDPAVSTQSPIQWMGGVFTGIKVPGP